MAGLPGASDWGLDPRLAYLDHGGFGAAPLPVLAQQRAWQERMERNPAGFLVHQLPELVAPVRAEVAQFLGADTAGLVFTENATAGLQTVIAQAGLRPGDEVLTTAHCYPAVLAQLRQAVEAAGAVLRIAPVPFPPSRAAVTEAVAAGLTGRTRLAVVDHVTSCSGLVLPVAEIAAECRRQGVPVLIDGAHAAGQVPVDLGRLGADFWVGNLHKWVCAPKSAAVLHAAPRWRDTLRPLIVSHGTGDGYHPAFDWTGTRDPTALLAVPAALAFFGQAGWPNVWQHNNELARHGAELVSRRLGTVCPDTDGMTAAMRMIKLPEPLDEPGARSLERRLREQHNIIVPVTCIGDWQWLRVSAQLYNTLADYDRLATALLAAA